MQGLGEEVFTGQKNLAGHGFFAVVPFFWQ
jgi:hypothetical protein